MEDDETGGGSLSLVFPLVEDNGCHKIKVAVLLQWANPPLLRDLVVLPLLYVVDHIKAAPPVVPLGGDLWGAPVFLVDLKQKCIKTKTNSSK